MHSERRYKICIYLVILTQWGLCSLPFTWYKTAVLESKSRLGRDKQRKLPFKIMYVFCLCCPSATFALQCGGLVPREWLAAKGLFDGTSGFSFRKILDAVSSFTKVRVLLVPFSITFSNPNLRQIT